MAIQSHIPGIARATGNYLKRHAATYTPSGNPNKGGPAALGSFGNDRNINNMWTGFERNYKGKIATGSLALGAGIYMTATAPQRSAEQRTQNFVQQQSMEGGVESLMSTRGDEIGYSVGMQRLSDLQSQGDLVFALNRLRN